MNPPVEQRHRLPQEQVAYLVEVATRAPSVHNSQPWLFRFLPDTIELLADRSRQLAVIDPEGRQLTMSCGAALFNLRLAVGHLGYRPHIELCPDTERPDLLARVVLAATEPQDRIEASLLSAVHRRHTHRIGFDDQPVAAELMFRLQQAAEQEGAELHQVQLPGSLHALAHLVQLAEQTEQADPAYRAELATWTSEFASAVRQGVPATSFPRRPAPPGPGTFPGRDFSLGAPIGLDLPVGGAQTITVLATNDDRPRDWLRAGQAMQRMLLLASRDWVFAAFLGQPLEFRHLRGLVRDEIGLVGFPQQVLGWGHARTVALTSRRPVDQVIIG